MMLFLLLIIWGLVIFNLCICFKFYKAEYLLWLIREVNEDELIENKIKEHFGEK